MSDPEAFRALYRAHYRTVCRYLALRVDPSRVEDIVAETFLVAWRRQAQLPEQPLPWLLNAASKILANHRRAGRRSAALVERLEAMTPESGRPLEEDVAAAGRRRALIHALAALGERDRELLMLVHWQGLTPREVATVLELSPVVIRTRLHRANRRLQSALCDLLDVDDEPRNALEEVPTHA
jgi:RNA polymerase sigma-70 factor, ECF subfamily